MKKDETTCSICSRPHLGQQLTLVDDADSGWCPSCRDYTPITRTEYETEYESEVPMSEEDDTPTAAEWQAHQAFYRLTVRERDFERVRVQRLLDDMLALASTISFLGSVIRSGEPFTPDVAQAIDNALDRVTRAQDGLP